MWSVIEKPLGNTPILVWKDSLGYCVKFRFMNSGLVWAVQPPEEDVNDWLDWSHEFGLLNWEPAL